MNKNKLLKASLITLSILAIHTAIPVMAFDNNSNNSKEVFIPVGNSEYRFNPNNPYVKSKGYHNIKGPDGKPMRYKEGYYGTELKIHAMLPAGFDTTLSGGKYTDKNNGALLDKYVVENSKNVAGKGGQHLINSCPTSRLPNRATNINIIFLSSHWLYNYYL